METVTVSPKYQVAIPQKIRESLGIKSGDKLGLIPFRGRLELIPVRCMRSMRGFLKGINTSLEAGGEQGGLGAQSSHRVPRHTPRARTPAHIGRYTMVSA